METRAIPADALAVLRHLRALATTAAAEAQIADRNFRAYASEVIGAAGLGTASLDLEVGTMSGEAQQPAASPVPLNRAARRRKAASA